MREWLTVIIVLLIVGVVLDGLRRMRQSRRSAIRLSRNVSRNVARNAHGDEPVTTAAEPTYGSELPSGGARVVNVRRPDDAKQFNRQLRENLHRKKRTLGRPYRIPEQVTLNLDEQVPTLMESVAADTEAQHQPEAESDTDFDDRGRIEPRFSPGDDPHPGEPQAEVNEPPPTVAQAEWPEDDRASMDVAADSGDEDFEERFDDGNDADTDGEEDYREPELVLVINVMAGKGERFDGERLLNVVLEQGMRYGTMNIFHRHEQSNGEGPILYSMANIVVPGTFDLNNMKQFSTPGVSLFQALPLEADSVDAFEKMLTTARSIAYHLGGELKDENRSVMTPQTIEHYRSRIREYERQQLSRAPA